MAGKHEMRVGFTGDSKKIEVEVEDRDRKPWDLDSEHQHVGGRHDRIDAVAKVTGRARYAFDVNLPGMLHGAMLRSSIPHGKVTALALDAARAMPGVHAVIALKDPSGRRNTVRFVGDPVAAVAAETKAQALDALERIEVAYERQAHTIDFLDADGAPRIENGAITGPWSDEKNAKEVEAALEASTHVHEGSWLCEVQTHSALESHGNVCSWDDANGTLEVWSSTQATFGVRAGLADAVGIGTDRVRVHAEFVGGGFGAKFPPGDEGFACARLSREAKRPVKLMLDRFEEHTCAGNRPSAAIRIRAGIDDQGTIKAWDYQSFGGPGFTGRGGSTRFPPHYTARAAARQVLKDLPTHTDAARAMRAPGWPQGCFAAEGMVDALAHKVGADPVAFRIHNEPQALRRAEWELGAERFGWSEKWRPWGTPVGEQRIVRGAGVAAAFWPQMGSTGQRRDRQTRRRTGPRYAVTCRIHKDGTVESRSGAQDIGTGMKTVLAILTAEELRIDPARVRVTMGCTDDPFGPASGGSTTTPSLAPAARLAAGRAKDQLRALVAEHLGVEPDRVTVEGGAWGVAGQKMLAFEDACKLIGHAPIEEGGERLDNYDGYADNVCGCQFAEVEVDTETGNVRVLELLAVQDCGLVIATKLAESQVIGAMIGGLSYVLHERRILDRARGRMLNGDMLWYKIAGMADMPKITAIMFPVANGKNSVGAAGLGEPPAISTPAAIANAVANAIGAPITRMPIMPDVVMQALATRRGGETR